MIYLFLSFPLIILIFVVFVFATRKNKAKKEIYNELIQLGEVKEGNKIYDYELISNDNYYLIKIIYNFDKLEISINNKNYWQVNDKIVSSKKGGAKLNDIYDLINETVDEKYKKIYIIYPDAKAIIKALNESELVFVNPTTNCYGVNVLKYNDIKEIINL